MSMGILRSKKSNQGGDQPSAATEVGLEVATEALVSVLFGVVKRAVTAVVHIVN
ncbi:hypothetical protein [Nocardia sp.]|uniref:hypothetical protein n=1 Tax=Nocardia sp. TaxID=1821 RepID=UPI0026070A9C|nr:hypothetical protein [Nocardia sp.]